MEPLSAAKPLIPLERIEPFLQLEPLLLTLGAALSAFVFYKIYLRKVAEHRHHRLKEHYRYMLLNGILATFLWVLYHGLQFASTTAPGMARFFPYIGPYVGIVAALCIARVLIKACRTLLLQYLFFNHMREGVPILIVNIFALVLSALVYGYLASVVFQFKLIPVVATSAMLSIVLGLALQDTLGNLFSGVALQVDNPYGIGDWVEITNDSVKWVGKVEEINWRATTLIGWTDEHIILPNKLIGQSSISNFSITRKPILRRLTIRLPYDAPVELAREALIEGALAVDGVRKEPSPSVLLVDATDSCIESRLLFYVDDYGQQFSIADQVLANAIESLAKKRIRIAPNRISVETSAQV